MTVGIEVGTRRSARTWVVDSARSSDGPALDTLFARCSAETVYRRFFGQPSRLPSAYRDAVLAEQPYQHDAVVARYGDGLHLAGLASLVADAGCEGQAELAVLVADDFQRHGVGAALVDALVARGRERGVERFMAVVLPNRVQLLAALARRYELVRLIPSADTMCGVFVVATPTVDRSAFDATGWRR